MIVNTAYPFMIAKTPAANPNLFENGVSNYQTAFNRASLDTSGLKLQTNATADFYGIPLSKFSILNFSGNGGAFSKSTIYIEVLDTNGTSIYTSRGFELDKGNSSPSNHAFTIPEQYRKDGYGIRFKTPNGYSAIIHSAGFST